MSQLNPQSQAKRLIHSTLERVLTDKEDGTVQYDEEVTDSSVAIGVSKAFPRAKVTAGMVAGIRNKAWGKLFKIIPKTPEEIIAELQAANEALAKENAILKGEAIPQEEPSEDRPDPHNLFSEVK